MFAIIGILTVTSSALADEVDIELQTRQDCIILAEDAFARIGTIGTTWFTDENSKTHIGKNFVAVVAKHQAFIDQVGDLQAMPLPQAGNKNRILNSLEKIDQLRSELTDEISGVAVLDDTLIRSLFSIEEGIEEVGQELAYVKLSCDRIDGEAIDSVNRILRGWQRQIYVMRVYINQGQAKRSMLGEAVLLARQTKLERLFAEVTQRNLRDARSEIEQILAADNFHNKFSRWWYRTAQAHGLTRGLSRKGLQYSAALRSLNLAKHELDELKTEWAQLEAPSQLTAQINRDISSAEARIADELSYVQNRGWEGYYTRQRDRVGRRIAVISEYPAPCQAALRAFHERAAESIKEEQFPLYEALYADVFELCIRGGLQ